MNGPQEQSSPREQTSLPLAQQQAINRVCRAFETAWRAAAQPKIEDYLQRMAAPLRPALLTELIASEIDLRQAAGEDVNVDEYHGRFPAEAAAVDAGWALIANRQLEANDISSTLNVSKDAKMDTGDQPPAAGPHTDNDAEPARLPSTIGRYEIKKLLGKGGFGRVYLAHDPQLQRQVALKVPRRKWLSSEKQLEAMLHEARAAARLKHPALVVVHDVQEDGADVYIVQEYVDGQDLRHWAQSNQPSVERIVRLMLEITEAIGFAHQQDLVHRDLKPGNILIDRAGHAHVADFGLALHENVQRLLKGDTSGTPAYMSPEQVRGETHLLDGRSDLWSIGVILYELLTGRRPFRGANSKEVFQEIQHRAPRPPRMIKPEISAELERICLKCLSKYQTDRYTSAAELLEDLQAWLEQPVSTAASGPTVEKQAGTAQDAVMPVSAGRTDSASAAKQTEKEPRPPRIVPKGLRSFDAHDADFFLELLPGARDRHGLPESIRFWKVRIEQTDPDSTFRVGLIYGPSGCGKSSLVKAGLLPRLVPHVTPIYVEATPEETEVRLLKGLRRHVEGTPDDVGLPELLAGLREGQRTAPGQKTLIVLDQFEQWLHARRGEQDTQLVKALRHCDGGRVQAVVLVRDDFWMPATRFMRDLEVPVLENQNSVAVDLFDPLHARKVLAEFGRAYDRLPDHTVELTAEQELFLDRAVNGLAQDGKIICVRLALFADMLKGKPWTPATLTQVGGTEGLGVTFLEETFSASTAPAAHRYHQKAAQAVLKALLPEVGSDIKGGRRSWDELLEASGYGNRPQDFQDLIQILDNEIRLITPTVPEGNETDVEPSDSGESAGSEDKTPQHASAVPSYYQLTHDYLVPSLRAWLTRKQKQTRRGRAELRLAERAAQWTAKPENRYLPKAWEDLNIRLFIRQKDRTEPQRRMMRKSGLVHGVQTLVAAALILVVVVVGLKIRDGIVETQNATRASGLVTTLLRADTSQVKGIIKDLADYRQWADDDLASAYAEPPAGMPNAKLHAALALLSTDPSMLEFVQDRLLSVSPNQFAYVRDVLDAHKDRVIDDYWQIAEDPKETPARRFQAACALATYDPDNAIWRHEDLGRFIANHLVRVRPSELAPWRDALRGVQSHLVDPLAQIFRDDTLDEKVRSFATDTLADYTRHDPQTRTSLLIDADAAAFKTLFPVLQRHSEVALQELQNVLQRKLEPDWNDKPRDPTWKTVDAATQAMIESAHGMIGARFAFCQDLAWSQFPGLAEKLTAAGYRPTRVRPYRMNLPAEVEGGTSGGPEIRVAAVWSRDGKRWKPEYDLTGAQLPKPDALAEKDGLVPADLAVLPAASDEASPHYVLLWGEPGQANEQRRLLADLSEKQLAVAPTTPGFFSSPLAKEGFAAQCTISVWTDHAGQRHYAGIYSNQGAPSELNPAYAGYELVGQPQWDVAVAPPAKLADPLDDYRRQLTQIQAWPPDALQQSPVRLLRARARFRLEQFEPALEDLDFLVTKQPVAAEVHSLRAWTLARLNEAEPARAELAKYVQQEQNPSMRAYVQVVTVAWLGDQDAALTKLAAAATVAAQDSGGLYDAACAAALAAQGFAESDRSQATKFIDRAVELLELAIDKGYADARHMANDADLVALHEDPRFLTLLKKIEPPARYTAVWRADVQFESRLVTKSSAEEMVRKSEQLVLQNYRPVAVAMSTQPLDSSLHPSIVFHRPIIPDGAKEQLAQRQATAAAALLRLNAPQSVWPLLQHQADPRLRSYLLHRLAPYGADPGAVIARLPVESEVSRRRALVLAIGKFARVQLLTDAQESSITNVLVKLFSDAPDPGIHGAAEWALRQLGADAEIAKVTAAYATGEVVGQRRWYVTSEGRHTLTILDAHDEFLMGSPVTEVDRYQGPTGKNEIQHRRRIDRRFAIGAHEVTVAQFKEFRVDHDFDRTKSREPDAPANMVSWYDAAQYCNWLSAREKIPRNEWCYDPDQKFAEGMTLPQNYLQRTGYRLPTEAEWEYACRAGSTTARYFGETDQLLGEYGWYTKTSGDKWMLPVGRLKPNDAGLFDMLGNVTEWCQESALLYKKDRKWMGDRENLEKLSSLKRRVLRGGSFILNASDLRSANRNSNQPGNRGDEVGFRVARTYP